jgi:hypothetical protein
MSAELDDVEQCLRVDHSHLKTWNYMPNAKTNAKSELNKRLNA